MCADSAVKPQSVDQSLWLLLPVVRTKAINAKMDQRSRRVFVARTIHRTFGRPQWQQLHQQLQVWQQNVSQVLGGFVNLQKSLHPQQTRWIRRVRDMVAFDCPQTDSGVSIVESVWRVGCGASRKEICCWRLRVNLHCGLWHVKNTGNAKKFLC